MKKTAAACSPSIPRFCRSRYRQSLPMLRLLTLRLFNTVKRSKRGLTVLEKSVHFLRAHH
ncbi:hypothetical protein [Paenibacillus glucanolyticus]|uniref:hypothetical protein n=1 Tax=Paenibacillus glucanolyticus TaxID=59843 RepID=UPI0018D298E7|nr:hypothetical protein [Paenibacillus glucanolyticus]